MMRDLVAGHWTLAMDHSQSDENGECLQKLDHLVSLLCELFEVCLTKLRSFWGLVTVSVAALTTTP